MGSFSVIVPIYLGAIFVFFIYIVAKIMMKKMDSQVLMLTRKTDSKMMQLLMRGAMRRMKT